MDVVHLDRQSTDYAQKTGSAVTVVTAHIFNNQCTLTLDSLMIELQRDDSRVEVAEIFPGSDQNGQD